VDPRAGLTLWSRRKFLTLAGNRITIRSATRPTTSFGAYLESYVILEVCFNEGCIFLYIDFHTMDSIL
jgi:hypothetical protein